MDTQIDHIAIEGILNRRRIDILKLMSEAAEKQDKDHHRCEVVLAMLVLLNNFELLFGDVMDYAKRHNLRVSTFSVSAMDSTHTIF